MKLEVCAARDIVCDHPENDRVNPLMDKRVAIRFEDCYHYVEGGEGGFGMGLDITIEKSGDTSVVVLAGRVIGTDDRRLQRKLESLFKKNDERIVLDISNTGFIDSHGLGIVVYYHTLMQKSGRELVLLNANSDPQAYMTLLLEMTNLNRVFRVVSSLDVLAE